jgi:membrane fusion protein (multidrug efflux system)
MFPGLRKYGDAVPLKRGEGRQSAAPLRVRWRALKSGVATLLCHRTLSIALLVAVGLFCGCERRAEVASSSLEPPAEVRVVHPHRGEIFRYIDLPGEVHPLFTATMFAKVDGYLKTLAVDKGDSVKEGDLLAEIDAPDLRANELRFKAELELAEAEFKQTSDSPTNNPVGASRAETVAAQNRIAVAKAHVSTARANLASTEVLLKYTRITAPFDGIITKRFVDPGAYIPVPNAADTPEAAAIVNVTDFQTLRMQVAVPENEVRHIKVGQPVSWTTDALPGEHFDGTVTRAYWALDRATKTMLTEVQLTNRNMMLRPGMLVNARIGLEKKEDALLVPLGAVLKEKMSSFAFAVVGGTAKKTMVKTGFNDGVSIEITEGLKPEDSIVLLQGQPLRDGQTVRVTSQ